MTYSIFWGSLEWIWPAAVLGGMAVALLTWSYLRSPVRHGGRWLAAALKLIAIAAVALCLLEPLVRSQRPRPGANLFLVVTDSSRSLTIRDGAGRSARSEELLAALTSERWQSSLAETFEVRRYAIDSRLRSVNDFEGTEFEGRTSRLKTALETLKQRHAGRPVAGVLLFTDGNATDLGQDATLDREWLQDMPPIYPVVVGKKQPPRDIRIGGVAVGQTLFETTPLTIRADADADGMDGKMLTAELLDETGQRLQSKDFGPVTPDRRPSVEFLVRPDRTGALFYQVRIRDRDEPNAFEQDAATREATLENNRRWVVAQRGQGPYRVLYVSGRPNWEFKFLRRAIREDEEVELIGLIRIAKKEPKFEFRGRRSDGTNPLFRGFEHPDEDSAERYDQPVLLRTHAEELAGGFPKTEEELFGYDALILDDVEAEFFSADQLTLLHRFVSARGGGLLMLGGQESFAEGGYARTRMDELLPVYLDAPSERASSKAHAWSLTREGRLQPWMRTRSTEAEESERVASMPFFQVLNRTELIKPGASVMAQVTDENGTIRPALVAQRFGEGRTAALLVGDWWRWAMRAEDDRQRGEPDQAWRQMVRWLVSDVPRAVEIASRHESEQTVLITVKARDAAFRPLENAQVKLQVQQPGGETMEVAAVSSPDDSGHYIARYASKDPGPYRAQVSVTGPDGETIGDAETGWVIDPDELELRSLTPHQEWLDQIASASGGKSTPLDSLDQLVNELPRRKAPVTEPWIYPLWHHWLVMVLAATCLVGEWGVRRWCGLP